MPYKIISKLLVLAGTKKQPNLHKNLSKYDVIIILEDSAEDNRDTISFGFHIHCLILTVVNYCSFFTNLLFVQKLKISFKYGRKTISLQ